MGRAVGAGPRMTRRRELLVQHVPMLLASDEELIYERAADPESDAADYAVRTCRCGVHIDGFYQYVDHLESVLANDELQMPLPITGA